jgi:glycosyltransferase involved in cell wall biosynthesis
MSIMKVLFQTYSLANQNPGGGERVIHHLFHELRALGVQIKLREPWQDHPEDFDLLHYFSMAESAHWPFFRANHKNLKIVVTPTFYLGQKNTKFSRWREMLGSNIGIYENKRMIDVNYVDHFFPNTLAEAGQLETFLGVDSKRISVIGNGISPIFGNVNEEEFRKFSGIQGDFILHVGRFDPVKNQDFLIKALSSQSVQCVFIGNPDPFSSEYFEKCRDLAKRAMKAKFYFFQEVQPDSSLLASAMAAAKVFALPSNFETFGIAALEAQASGCRLLLSDGVVAKEFFPEAKFLPLDEGLWAASLLENLRSTELRKLAAKESFHWRNLAENILNEYQKILRK